MKEIGMDQNFDSEMERVFQSVSDLEVDRNPALCRQTEKIRRLMVEFFRPTSDGCLLRRRNEHSPFSRAGEYAVFK
jgi:hypothetical protein